MTLDVLALAAHPDDVELSAGGTVCALTQQGYRVGIIDFTRGELGSRGTPEGRLEEAAEASRILGLAARHNLGLPDGHIENTPATQRALMRYIRRYRPAIVLMNPLQCRHPDHGAAHRLATDTLFYSGLRKIETVDEDGSPQEPWRPHHALTYIQSVDVKPTLVVDVTDVWPQRVAALQAFKSQFYNPDYTPGADEPETYISNPTFFEWVEGRARHYGYQIGATYGEPFLYPRAPLGTQDLVSFLRLEKTYR
ncbi:MAG: bacillithiol biosynthesis deacetylase BshB1 [Bacteroidota bacterium]